MFGTNKVKCQMWGGGVDLPPMEGGGLDALSPARADEFAEKRFGDI